MSNHSKVWINLEMEFAVKRFSGCIDHFKSVATVSIHVTVAEWCSAATKQKRYLMRCFWSKTQEVPEHIRILPHQYTTPASPRTYQDPATLTHNTST